MWILLLFISVLFRFISCYESHINKVSNATGPVPRSSEHPLALEYLFERIHQPHELEADTEVIEFEDGVKTTLLCSVNNKTLSDIHLRWEVDQYELKSEQRNPTVKNIALVFTPDTGYNGTLVSCAGTSNSINKDFKRDIILIRSLISKNEPRESETLEAFEGHPLRAHENNHCIMEYQNSTRTKFIPSNILIDKTTMDHDKLKILCAILNDTEQMLKRIPREFELYKMSITQYLVEVEKPERNYNIGEKISILKRYGQGVVKIESSFFTYTVIAGVAGFVILLIILLIVFKYIRRSRAQKLIENTYEEPRYTEIQLDSHGPIPERQTESPYAKIIGIVMRTKKPVLPARNPSVIVNTNVTFDSDIQVNSYANINVQVDVHKTVNNYAVMN